MDEQIDSDIRTGIDDASEDSDVVYLPECAKELKPYVGMKFPTLEEAEQFYRDYGAVCGFDVRLGTVKRSNDGIILWRYVLCNREGEKNIVCDKMLGVLEAGKKKRRRVSSRMLCLARIIFRYTPRVGYVVKGFHEAHSHPLISNGYRQFMRVNRSLNYVHKNFILSCARANIGPMRSFRLFKELVGSYDNVGCNGVDFKNFARDLRAFADGADAHMLLEKLKGRRESCPGFYFDYFVDSRDKFKRLFWADSLSIENFHKFGDAVSFDATYSTNRYNMIFAPFTGKDNHGKCVTFGAGLLSAEDVDSYSWLFSHFVDCMGESPRMLITDQDPAMKIAVEKVMPDTRHRFCMWHIMLKVGDKISKSLREDEEFANKFKAIVWSNYIEPSEFEHRWQEIMEEFDLTEHPWFISMFELRSFWIPAYFRDFSMSGLFRTMSMSESENNFFRSFFNMRSNLVVFYFNFLSAMEAQRLAHDKLNSVDESSIPDLLTHLPIEKHAASLYSNKIFLHFQDEWVAAVNICCINKMLCDQGVNIYEVDDNMKGVFTVKHNVATEHFTCGCNHFVRYGVLCRHILLMFKNMNLTCILDRYIVSRWNKRASSCISNHVTCNTQADVGATSFLNKEVLDRVLKCVGFVSGNSEHLSDLLKDLDILVDKYENVSGSALTGRGHQQLFENFYGSSIPENLDVLPPDPVKTKGSGSRLKSRKEKSLRDINKPKRKCSRCKQLGNHDARNCPMVSTTEEGT